VISENRDARTGDAWYPGGWHRWQPNQPVSESESLGGDNYVRLSISLDFSIAGAAVLRLLPATLLATAAMVGAVPAAAQEAAGKVPAAVPMKVQRYARDVIEQHDTDRDGRLTQQEWQEIGDAARLANRDRDDVLTAAELAEHIARYGRRRRIRLMPAPAGQATSFPSLLRPDDAAPQDATDRLVRPGQESTAAAGRPGAATEAKQKPTARRYTVPPSHLPAGLPSWFRALDRNGDAQLTLAEFAPDGAAADIQEFQRYDGDGDGLLTAQEFVRGERRPQTANSKVQPEPMDEQDESAVDASAEAAEPDEPDEPDDADQDAAGRAEAAEKPPVRDDTDSKRLKRSRRSSATGQTAPADN
jgi:hypothetical protein